ncbi:MAG: SdpI family protein [Ruminococcus sp.]|nr:SdpI family protein [Ruminococcus sp.]
MIRNNKWKLILGTLVTLLPIPAGLILWDKLPATLATHWGADGTANGQSSKLFAVFIIPLILLALYWICILVTAKDNKNRNQNQKIFDIVIWIVPVLSCIVSGIIYAASMNTGLNLMCIMPLVMGLVFMIIGNYLPKCKQNKTIGIKLKWTLENEENWNATHRISGKVWFLGGLLMLPCALLPDKILIPTALVLILVMVLIPTLYSYLYYKNQMKNGTYTVSDSPDNHYNKTAVIISLVAVALILAFCVIMTFTGNVYVEMAEDSFTVDATYWSSLTVEYEAIDSIEYRDHFDRGTRTAGLGSPRLMAGSFSNDEFGNYTLYSYTDCDCVVVLTIDEKVLVINAKTPSDTDKLYKELLAK